MSESTDGEVLLAEGVTVQLAGGEIRPLRISNRAMVQIEKRYGSAQAYLDKLREGAFYTHLTALFSICWGIREDQALELIDGRQMKPYFQAVTDAVSEALGLPAEAGEVPSQASPSAFPGDASTRLQSSPAESTPSVSGA
jgi:hypothetical protein